MRQDALGLQVIMHGLRQAGSVVQALAETLREARHSFHLAVGRKEGRKEELLIIWQ